MTANGDRGVLVDSKRNVTLVELADRLLDTGVVLSGEIVLTLAGVDLVYISLRALIASVDAAMGRRAEGVDASTDDPPTGREVAVNA